MNAAPIRILVVDDSRVIQGVLKRMLSRIEHLEVVGTAENVDEARRKLGELAPDVMTLDVNMPGTDGLDFLDEIMAQRPLPVVVLSSMVGPGTAESLRATKLGAAAVVPKPIHGSTPEFQEMLATLERVISRACGRRSSPSALEPAPSPVAAPSRPSRAALPTPRPSPKPAIAVADLPPLREGGLVVIGSSTGGPRALRELLGALPANMPPIVIAQHMPSNFTDSLARRLDAEVALEVVEARSGDPLVPGRVLVAPGHMHLKVRRGGKIGFVHTVEVIEGHIYRPSVDVLMESAAKAYGDEAIGVLLTGMGTDGAQGLLALRKAGAHTVVEDKSTAMIFGMPRAAIEAGAAEQTRPLPRIAGLVVDWLSPRRARAASTGT